MMTAQILLYIHIAAGSLALAIGALAAVAKKGVKLHIMAGKVFVVSMAITAVSAIALSIIRPNPFLLGIGFFTGYLVSSGWIWARPIRVAQRVRYARFVALASMAPAAYMLYHALSHGFINIIMLVFGGILLSMAIPDAVRRKNPVSPIRLHAGRIGGAYIAAFTAFLTVNLAWGLLVWLGPTFVGAPLIFMATRMFDAKKKKASNGVK